MLRVYLSINIIILVYELSVYVDVPVISNGCEYTDLMIKIKSDDLIHRNLQAMYKCGYSKGFSVILNWLIDSAKLPNPK